MSKPITHDEVEDVLSSIRRLVSEDKRPLAGLRNSTPELQNSETESQERAQDRLVLTPSLRVAHPPETEADDTEAPLDLAEVSLNRDASDDMDDGEAAASSDAEDIASAIDDEEMIDTLLQEAFAKEIRKGDSLLEAVDDATDLRKADPESVSQDEDEIIFAMPAQEDVPEAGFIEVEEDWEDADPVDEYVAGQDADEIEETDSEEAADAEAGERQDPLVLMPENARTTRLMPMDTVSSDFSGLNVSAARGHTDQADRSQSLTSKIAALETAIGAMRQGFEPDGDESDALAPRKTPPLAWEDDVELDARGTPMPQEASGSEESEESPEPSAAKSPTQGAGLELDDQLMDEEALRDLVSEIVRAELQGALGERITRNVRKLVRREIHRALTAQEME